MNNEVTLVAVDVSKNTLEIKTDYHAATVPNSEAGISKMLSKLAELSTNLFVVCEASGGYERLLMETMHERGIPICRANPARVRAFSVSEGIRAKTDPIDAQMILKFAKDKQLRPTLPQDPVRKKMAAYLDRRDHLKEMLAREKNRIQNSPKEIHDFIERSAHFLEKEIEFIEQLIREVVESDVRIEAQVKCFTRIKGIGEITAWVVVAFLGEITSVNRNQLSALAGLAPFNRDSGIFKGKRKIVGGRAKVRSALYMAAPTAAIHNPVIKEYVSRLRSKGKPYKCAIVAAMRKLLIHMQAEVKKLDLEVV